MSVPVRSATELRDRLYAALRHEKSCTCGECSGGLNAVEALVALADEAAKFKRAHEVAAKFANQNIERAVNAEARVAELETALAEIVSLPNQTEHYSEADVCVSIARAALVAGSPAGQDDPDYSPAYQDEYQRLWHEAAAERDHMRAALERIEENARQGKIRSEMVRVDCLLDSQEWPVHETIHAFSVIRMLARAGLSQPGNTQP